MISVDEALALVSAHGWASAPSRLPMQDVLGCALANDIMAPFDLPRFDNAAMDGYAVGSADGPWRLVSEIPAGGPLLTVRPGEAMRIFTGGPVPIGAFAVVAQEECHVNETTLQVVTQWGRHIRRRGEECRSGDIVLRARTRVTPGVVGTLCSLGLTSVEVLPPPCIGILSTGSEVVAAGESVGTGSIYESNGPAIAAACRQLGLTVNREHVRDNLSETVNAAARLLSTSNAILTIGGISVGDYDFVERALLELQFQQVFAGVSMRPGKPISFAVRNDGKVWFALPGNPMSAMFGFLIFVRHWLGQPLRWIETPIVGSAESGARESFLLASIATGGVAALPTVGSHALTGWSRADGLIHLRPNSKVRDRELVSFALLDW